MDLEQKLDEYIGEWIEHCISVRSESNPQRYLRCTAYTSLVALGEEILPRIHEHIRYTLDLEEEDILDDIPAFCYTNLVRDIVGTKFKVPENIHRNDREIKIYAHGWLSGYLSNKK